jgi:hypothetical protein
MHSSKSACSMGKPCGMFKIYWGNSIIGILNRFVVKKAARVQTHKASNGKFRFGSIIYGNENCFEWKLSPCKWCISSESQKWNPILIQLRKANWNDESEVNSELSEVDSWETNNSTTYTLWVKFAHQAMLSRIQISLGNHGVSKGVAA